MFYKTDDKLSLSNLTNSLLNQLKSDRLEEIYLQFIMFIILVFPYNMQLVL